MIAMTDLEDLVETTPANYEKELRDTILNPSLAAWNWLGGDTYKPTAAEKRLYAFRRRRWRHEERRARARKRMFRHIPPEDDEEDD